MYTRDQSANYHERNKCCYHYGNAFAEHRLFNAITQLYLSGALSVGSMMAGLLTGSGVGLLVLFRVNHNRKENLSILGLVYLIGVISGILIELIM